jgi:hypothetical protein
MPKIAHQDHHPTNQGDESLNCPFSNNYTLPPKDPLSLELHEDTQVPKYQSTKVPFYPRSFFPRTTEPQLNPNQTAQHDIKRTTTGSQPNDIKHTSNIKH